MKKDSRSSVDSCGTYSDRASVGTDKEKHCKSKIQRPEDEQDLIIIVGYQWEWITSEVVIILIRSMK